MVTHNIDFDHPTESVPVSFVFQLVEGALSNGYSIGPIHEDIKALKEQGVSRVSLDHYFECFWALRCYLQDELLGLFPSKVPIGVYPTLCHALIHMDNMQQCYAYMNEMYRIFNNGTPPWQLETNANSSKIIISQQKLAESAQPLYQQSMLLTSYKTLSWLLGATFEIKRVGFTHKETDYARELRYLFSAPVNFDVEAPFIEFSNEIMHLPVIRSHSDLSPYLSESLNTIIQRYFGNPFIDNLKSHVLLHVKSGFQSLPQVSQALGMSSASFSRKLSENGTSYSKLKDELRRDLAMKYLSKSKLSVKEVAIELGFSEYSSFHRAFKKWVGMTPAIYQQCVTD